MKKLIKGGTVVNEGRVYRADVFINGEIIERIEEQQTYHPEDLKDVEIIDASNMFVMPGIIDDQVHFREPGLTRKGDIREGSRAAAAGGVTSFMDMPNVSPATTTNALLKEKQEIAQANSWINYSFYLGATTDNIEEIKAADPSTTCGIKVFMGSSTGNMLVDAPEALEKIFAESPLLIATHCEDNTIIQKNLSAFQEQYGEDIPVHCHPLIRSRECCYASSSIAVKLARKHNSRLHLLHLSTAEEIGLLDKGERKLKKITGEVCIHHLWFNDKAYLTKGNLVKWNPAIKTEDDRIALLNALKENRLDVIATDHAPHLPEEKEGPYTKAASGGPMVQHSLAVMMELMEKGEISLPEIVEHMCHAPADIFRIEERGYLREGYKADIVLLSKAPWKVEKENIRYKCGWSPLEGDTLTYRVATTFVNGKIVYDKGNFSAEGQGQLLRFTT